jgi:alpha 1,6-mannosyltransferase
MITYRRGFLGAVCIFALLYVLTSSRSPSVPALNGQSPGRNSNGRSYPPAITQKNKPPNQQTIESIETQPLRERLRYQFPYDRESKFPAYIWQTWKYSPSSGNFGEDLRPLEASWTEQHPGFIHEVLTDDAAYHLIKYLYASVPEVTEAYNSMPLAVLKADFFRYLILLARGGIYSDIDTQALKPTTEWLPEKFDRSTVGLVIGIEADATGRKDWAQWYARRIQFCQWTIQSKPGHPALRNLVATITEDTLRMKKQGMLQATKLGRTVMEFTGPAVFTDAIFSYLNDKSYFDFSAGKNVSAIDFASITRQKKVGDVVVLPITSFSPGVDHMGSKPITDPMAFVKHEFSGTCASRHLLQMVANLSSGSWKPPSERMKDS